MGVKSRMLRMCRLPDAAGDECFPKWFKDMFGKHMDEVTKGMSIATAVERNFVIDDAEVPLYPALTKIILKRDWTGSVRPGKKDRTCKCGKRPVIV